MGRGSSTRRGGGRKLRTLLESLFCLGFEAGNLGCPGNFAGISRTPGGIRKALKTPSTKKKKKKGDPSIFLRIALKKGGSWAICIKKGGSPFFCPLFF